MLYSGVCLTPEEDPAYVMMLAQSHCQCIIYHKAYIIMRHNACTLLVVGTKHESTPPMLPPQTLTSFNGQLFS